MPPARRAFLGCDRQWSRSAALFNLFSSLYLCDHSSGHRTVCFWIDKDECAGNTILSIAVQRDGAHELDSDNPYPVHLQRLCRLVLEGVDIGAIVKRRNHSWNNLAGVLQ